MSTIKIEKGIPVAPSRWGVSRKKRGSKYPFNRMEVGDSFFVPAKAGATKRLASRLSGASFAFAKTNAGYHFKVRTLTEPVGVRVWRVAAKS